MMSNFKRRKSEKERWAEKINNDKRSFVAGHYLNLSKTNEELKMLLKTNDDIWKSWCKRDFGNMFDGTLPIWIDPKSSKKVIPWRRCYIWFMYFFRVCVKYMCEREVKLANGGKDWNAEIWEVLKESGLEIPNSLILTIETLKNIHYNNFLNNPDNNVLVLEYSTGKELLYRTNEFKSQRVFTLNYGYDAWSRRYVNSMPDFVAATLGTFEEVLNDEANHSELKYRFDWIPETPDGDINIKKQKSAAFHFIMWSIWIRYKRGNGSDVEMVSIPKLKSLPVLPMEKSGIIYVGSSCSNCDSTDREILLCSNCLGE